MARQQACGGAGLMHVGGVLARAVARLRTFVGRHAAPEVGKYLLRHARLKKFQTRCCAPKRRLFSSTGSSTRIRRALASGCLGRVSRLLRLCSCLVSSLSRVGLCVRSCVRACVRTCA